MSVLHKNLLKNRLPQGFPPRSGRTKSRDFTPLTWDKGFDQLRDVQLDGGEAFRVYLSGFDDDDSCSTSTFTNVPLLLLLHGGGYSGLSWALFSKSIRSLCRCKIAAPDLRGHGETVTQNDDDLSAATLARDVGKIIKALHKDEDDIPPVVIVGHSMGGAIAVHAINSLHEMIPSLIGLVVIDVVEGTALDALQSMHSVLRSRPSRFQTVTSAIEWCVKSGQTRNLEAARISMPGMLKNESTGKPATSGLTRDTEQLPPTKTEANCQTVSHDRILEDAELEDAEMPEFASPSNVKCESGFVWRINLAKSEPFWTGWFEGLSSLFLSCPVGAKLLLLAGIDRLDKTLTIGQMQGKFQMQVLPQCGHVVHEDVPDKVAEAVASFMIRNRFTESVSEFSPVFPSC